jgi:antitoxin component YwqK of YwqJK toxin-antitoxin module
MCTFKDGLLCGERKEWFQDEDCYFMSLHAFYIADNEQGEYKEFLFTEELHVQCFYLDGQRHGEFKEWDFAAGQRYLATHCFYDKGRLHGEYKKYDEHERLIKSYVYNMNEKEGIGRRNIYTATETINKICEYKYKSRHGAFIKYLNGVLVLQCHYSMNKLHGDYKSWHADGALKMHCNYASNRISGNLFYSIRQD